MVTHDVRAIANFVLDRADQSGISISNLALNKIIYFLHVAWLHEVGESLVSAKIEAWDHGPVFREVYHQFKAHGRSGISSRAKRINPVTGEYQTVDYALESEEHAFLCKQCEQLLPMSASRLVDLSHVRDGAWHEARYVNGRVNPGIEITNDLILSAGNGQERH